MKLFINFLFVLTIILMCSIPVCAASNKQYVISSFSYQSANGKRITYKILYNKSGLIDKIQTDYGRFNFTYENGGNSKIELTEYEFPSVYNYTIKIYLEINNNHSTAYNKKHSIIQLQKMKMSPIQFSPEDRHHN